MYVCPQIFASATRLTVAYGHTAGVRNIFPSPLCGCH